MIFQCDTYGTSWLVCPLMKPTEGHCLTKVVLTILTAVARSRKTAAALERRALSSKVLRRDRLALPNLITCQMSEYGANDYRPFRIHAELAFSQLFQSNEHSLPPSKEVLAKISHQWTQQPREMLCHIPNLPPRTFSSVSHDTQSAHQDIPAYLTPLNLHTQIHSQPLLTTLSIS